MSRRATVLRWLDGQRATITLGSFSATWLTEAIDAVRAVVETDVLETDPLWTIEAKLRRAAERTDSRRDAALMVHVAEKLRVSDERGEPL